MNKVPAIYIYKRTSDQGRELRFSMRSLTNVQNWNGQVFVSGDRESWFSDKVQMIDTFVRSHEKYVDAKNKLRAIVEDKRVPDDFLFFNDDFYITKPTEVKPLYDGKLEGVVGKNEWVQSKYETRAYLEEQGIKNPLNYAIHVPIPYEKQKLMEVLDIIDANPDKKLMVRSLYGNLFKIGGKQYKVRKAQNHRLLKGDLLSTRLFTKELEKLLPEKSDFEK